MFKSEYPCKDCGESHYIQNKKKHLCSECVFKLNHDGKTKEQVYSERSKQKNTKSALIDNDWSEMSTLFMKNKQAQDAITETDEGEERKFFEKEKVHSPTFYEFDVPKSKAKPKRIKRIKQISPEQAEIERRYKIMIADMDYTEEKVCSGCLRYQGGEIRLSHSHLISRKRCKEIGRPELIYDRENIQYHCMNFGEHKGCHEKWEHPEQRKTLCDYEKNMKYVNKILSDAKSN